MYSLFLLNKKATAYVSYTVKHRYLKLGGATDKLREIRGFENIKVEIQREIVVGIPSLFAISMVF